MNNTPHVFLFDCDGVLTNKNQETNRDVLKKIAGLVERGNLVAFITGRSVDWTKKEVLSPLENLIINKSFLENIRTAAEFGGVDLTFKDSEEKIHIEKDLVIPQELRKEADKITSGFDKTTWVELKQTVASYACIPGGSVDNFKEDQKELAKKLEELLKDKGLNSDFEVQTDLLGTNIRNRQLNKLFATKKVTEWVDSKITTPSHFYAFGDSKSDLEMADELKRQNRDFDFIFVGEEKIQPDFEAKFTEKKLDQGTLEYLNSLN